jgi:hypothetical protein
MVILLGLWMVILNYFPIFRGLIELIGDTDGIDAPFGVILEDDIEESGKRLDGFDRGREEAGEE